MRYSWGSFCDSRDVLKSLIIYYLITILKFVYNIAWLSNKCFSLHNPNVSGWIRFYLIIYKLKDYVIPFTFSIEWKSTKLSTKQKILFVFSLRPTCRAVYWTTMMCRFATIASVVSKLQQFVACGLHYCVIFTLHHFGINWVIREVLPRAEVLIYSLIHYD